MHTNGKLSICFPGCSPAPPAAAVYYSVKNKMGCWLLTCNCSISFIHEMVHANCNCIGTEFT